MRAKLWCRSSLRIRVTASSSQWSSMCWIPSTLNCSGRREPALTTASPFPSNCHQVRIATLLKVSLTGFRQILLMYSNLFPGVSNEARFVFSVQSIVMPQKLKGTLTFIVKVRNSHTHTHTRAHTFPYVSSVSVSNVDVSIGCFLAQSEESSTHEKLDFKLHFTCTSYLITTPCYR